MNKYQRFLVGTLFDQEEQTQKTNLHNMKAKDPMGNTRWKGAFTGGFQAGYKNTCGSKEGWAPATFVSSVHKKSEKQERSIFDYMDKEDLGRDSVTQTISVAPSFRNDTDINLQTISSQSIGQSILKRLKKMQAHIDAPQDEEDMNKLFDLYAHNEQKDQVHTSPILRDIQQPYSIGGNTGNIEADDFIEAYQDFYRKVIRGRQAEESQQDVQKRKEENRVYFDFTRPMEQQPQYLKEIQEIDDLQQPRKRKKNLINQLSLKKIYTPSTSFKQFSQPDQLDRAPEDYDPYERMRGSHSLPSSASTTMKKPLTTEKRSQMLKEQKLSSKFISSQNSLANKFVSNDKKVIELVKFFEEEKKNKRFNEYIEQMEGKRISSRLETLSFEEAEREREQFQQKYKEYLKSKNNQNAVSDEIDPTSSNQISSRAHQNLPARSSQVQKNETFQITRKIQSWHPSKNLCKRYNVLMPYLESSAFNQTSRF